MSSIAALRASALLGFLAVALGAFGAHALEGTLLKNDTLETWKTASLYHLVHAAVLLFIAARAPLAAWAWRWFAAGVFIFSGSLYVLALTNIRWLGAVTPVGGICLLAGWLALAMSRR